MAELLIELFMEEIPARMQVRAADDFKRLVTDKLSAAGITFDRAEAHSTPRRLALVVDGLPTAQADVREEKKGPRVGSPEQALAGFLKSAGLSSIDQVEQRDTGKGVFYFAVIEKKGGATADALPGIIDAAIKELPWPKSMRWGSNDFRWVRPLHSIIALFDGAVVQGSLDLGAGFVPYGGETQGHRFLSPGPIAVTGFADYKDKLLKAHVVLDREFRKRLILTGAEKAAKDEGYVLKDDPGLLEEVAGLVEWPVVLTGAIDDKFMDVPAAVLTTSMRTHQRYFAMENKIDRTLAPRFVVVANRTTFDGGKAVIAGNERVLRARLSDAKFFWGQDLKVKLDDRVSALGQVTFHQQLGTMLERVDRIQMLAGVIADMLQYDDDTTRLTERAALLCKADLVTNLVGEFPEVQGYVGSFIAKHFDEPAGVWRAMTLHYQPQGPASACPKVKEEPVSVAISLADKLDTLAGFFAINEKPTGSRDPFALRRAALGAIRLVVENGLRIHLSNLFNEAAKQLRITIPAVPGATGSIYALDGDQRQNLTADLLSFFHDRLKVSLKEKGVRHDLIDAILALGGEDDFVRLLARVDALSGFLATDDGANLLAAAKRASNILRIEEKKDGPHDGAVDASLLSQDEEKALADALVAAHKHAAPLIAAEDFTGAMAAFAALRAPVDAFFDKVTVNAPDAPVRANRLRLLSQIRATLNLIADFSKIEG